MNEQPTEAPARLIHSPWISITVPALIGLGATFLSIQIVQLYGVVLFVALPVLVSFLAAFCHCFRRRRSFGSAYGIAALSLLTLGGMIILVALDGLICILMASPLAFLLALAGTCLGRLAGGAADGKASSILPLVLIFLFPCLTAFEDRYMATTVLRPVKSQVEIEAPVGDVWKAVVAFSRIKAEPDGIFRAGIAYPIEATIEGQGAGAVRYCKFCTGDFVEPITTWDENRLLAFDVRSSPPPMKEFSIYEHVDTPHLHGHMASEKGQFRLEQRGNKVLLEGTTWYRHEMWPQWYWLPITDHIIHKIHHRVLDHIKATVEKPPVE